MCSSALSWCKPHTHKSNYTFYPPPLPSVPWPSLTAALGALHHTFSFNKTLKIDFSLLLSFQNKCLVDRKHVCHASGAEEPFMMLHDFQEMAFLRETTSP